jgi:very-long-chain enoyl-CoA reductase
MPLTNLPKNCFHYWVLGGLFVAYPLYHPSAPIYNFGLTGVVDTPYVTVLVLLWFFAQMGNLTTHIILRNLRPEGSKVRQVYCPDTDPQGIRLQPRFVSQLHV